MVKGYLETTYALMNVGRTFEYPKGLDYYLHLTPKLKMAMDCLIVQS